MIARRDIIVVCAAGLLGLAGGLLAGSNTEEIRKGSDVSISPRRASRNDITRGDEARSYEALRRRVKNGGMVPKAGADFLSSAGRDEILAEMESLAASYNSRNDWGGNRGLFGSLAAAARELYRRDGVAAVESAEKNKASVHVLRALIMELCREDPELAAQHRKRFFERFGFLMGTDFALAEMKGAAGRSADEFLDVEKNYSGYPLDGEFAEDFDFKSYLAKSKSSTGIVSAMEYWSASDPDAAAEALRSGSGSEAGGGQFFAALNGRAAMVGEDKAAEWIVGAMDGLSDGKWNEAFRSFSSRDPSGGRIAALLNHLPDGKRRYEFAAAAVGSYRMAGDTREFIAENYPEEFRIRVAEAWLENSLHRGMSHAGEQGVMMMDDLRIPEARREGLKVK